jgi:phage major head subunit gpT-like protein
MAGLANFQAFTNLAVALTALWDKKVINTAAVAPLFNVKDSTGAVERTKGLGKMGLVPEYNGAIEFDEVDPLDLATYTHKEYARGIRIARKLLDDGDYGLIESMTLENAEGFSRTQSNHMVSVFNNAFSSSYTGPDGKALCATNHSSGSKPSFNNKGTSALTHDNVVATRQLMRRFKDEAGNTIAVNPNILVVPTELEATAYEITQSVGRSDNANNAANVNSKMGYIVEPLLSDANNWFMVDSGLASMYLRWFWRVQPEFLADPKSDFDLELRMRGYMRYVFGWDTHIWVYGHEVA